MKEQHDYSVFAFLIKAGGVILVLLLALALLTSAVTGISIFNPAIMNMLSDIFKIALVVLFLLLFIPFFVIVFLKKGDVSLTGTSALIKDNALRYEYYENGKKKKKIFALTNINKYLNDYKQMYVIENMILSKNDKNNKPNANSLFIELPDKRKISLRQLSSEDKDLYNRLCAFLDSISELDEIALQFRLGSLVQKETILYSAKEAINSLNAARSDISDEDILKQLDYTLEKLSSNQDNIDNNYTVRKLYEKYLKLLVEICNSYAVLERHNTDPNNLIKTKSNLMNAFALINNALEKSENRDEIEFESEVENIEQVLNK